jgi:hypothetical protein
MVELVNKILSASVMIHFTVKTPMVRQKVQQHSLLLGPGIYFWLPLTAQGDHFKDNISFYTMP